jgi:hypothetical protein
MMQLPTPVTEFHQQYLQQVWGFYLNYLSFKTYSIWS